MSKFAKLFECPENGQILVMLDTNDDDQYVIKLYGQPKNLGVSSTKLTFDEDAPDEQVQEFFDEIDLKFAQIATKDMFKLGNSIGENMEAEA